MITKELFNKVYGYEVKSIITNTKEIHNSINIYKTDDNAIAVYDGMGWKYINLYEIANKCKEWAHNNNFILMSGKIDDAWDCEFCTAKYYKYNGFCNINTDFGYETEYDAIFDACEKIIELIKEDK